jgi:hypothetical protein
MINEDDSVLSDQSIIPELSHSERKRRVFTTKNKQRKHCADPSLRSG